MGIVSSVKIGVDTAATAAGKLDGFAKASEKALADGKTLNLFEDAIRGVKLFGQANIALQCLSMGLKAIDMLLGGTQSEESQVLEGIDKVLGRIDALSKDVNTHFDQLSKQLFLQTGQLQLQAQLVNVENAEGYLAQINARKSTNQPVDTLESQLALLNPTSFSALMVQIHDSCVGTGTPTAPNVLSTLYDWTYGDIKTVWAMGEFLLHKATIALMLHGIVAALQNRGSSVNVDPAQIASLYKDKLEAVADAVAKWAGDCISAAERPKNVRRWLDANTTTLSVDASDKQGTSRRIADALQAHWAYLDVSVIVYDPVAGFDHHGLAGSSCLSAFQHKDINSKPVNIVLYWADRTSATRRGVVTYQSAAADASAFKGTNFQGSRKDRSFDVTTSAHWPQRPSGARYQFVYDLAQDANRAGNHAPAAAAFYGNWGNRSKDLGPILNKFIHETDSTKHEPGSLLWIFFSDGFDDYGQTNIGLTAYTALYGVVAPYTTVCFFPT
jgi:hypothetical protein